jgi:hypothetical protein
MTPSSGTTDTEMTNNEEYGNGAQQKLFNLQSYVQYSTLGPAIYTRIIPPLVHLGRLYAKWTAARWNKFHESSVYHSHRISFQIWRATNCTKSINLKIP